MPRSLVCPAVKEIHMGRRIRNLLISTAFLSTLIMPSAAVFADSTHGNSANAPGQNKAETTQTNTTAGNSNHSQGNAGTSATPNQPKEQNANKTSAQTSSIDH